MKYGKNRYVSADVEKHDFCHRKSLSTPLCFFNFTKPYSMEACVRLINLTNLTDSKLIERNLHRILDVSLISFDLQNQALRFHYEDPKVYDEVVQELKRLGHPVEKCLYQGKDLPLQTS